MSEKERTYRISEVARELGISTVWLRKGEERGFFLPARRDPTNGHRYYTRADVERLKARRARRTGGRREGGGDTRA
jgi:DNA-binding transcriptional MerR regulator